MTEKYAQVLIDVVKKDVNDHPIVDSRGQPLTEKQPMIKWEGFPVKKYALKDTWQSCKSVEVSNIPFWDALINDIQSVGMKNPIIIIESTVGMAWIQKQKYKKSLLDPPGNLDPIESDPPHETPLAICWGGSNRIAVLRKLEYTHADCVILKDFAVAFTLQNKQREGFQHIHNARKRK